LIDIYRDRVLGAVVEYSGACAVTSTRVYSTCRIVTILVSVSVSGHKSSQSYEMCKAANNMPCMVSVY